MPEVFITHPRLRPPGPHYDILKKAGFDIRLPSDDSDTMQVDQLIEQLGNADAAIAGLEPYNREVIMAAPNLRVVARCGVGYETVDTEAADERSIAVTTTPGTNEHSVAEHALAMMLSISRGFPKRDLIVRGRRPWTKPTLPRFAGQTVGIIGLGRIGRALAMRLPSLQVKVLAYEPYPNEAFIKEYNIELTDLDDLLARSDMISLHTPVTDETRLMINKDSLAKMKPGAMLVNTARGHLIVEEDLHDALVSGHLAAAGLDVLQDEPPADDHPLLDLENVLLCPHAAGVDTQSHHDSVVLCGQVIADLYEGRWPEHCVMNLEGVSGWKW